MRPDEAETPDLVDAMPPAGSEPAPSRSRRPVGAAIVLYAVLAVVLTWPLAARLGSAVPAGTHDVWQNYWNFWWWKTALWEQHQSPYHTDRIFQPLFADGGAPLGCHTHSPANILLFLPVNIVFGVSAALDLAVLAGFALAGIGAFLLARQYTRSAAAAFIAGLVYAYFPQHVEQSLEHLNLASVQGLPLALWALVRMVRQGGVARIALCGALFAYNALLSWHAAMLVIPLAVGVFLLETARAPRPALRIIGETAAAAAITGLLIAPFLAPLIETVVSGEADFRKATAPKPIDALFLVVPQSGQPIWGNAVAEAYRLFRSYPSVGFVGYLGIVAICLAAALPWSRQGRSRDRAAGAPRGAAWLWLGLGAFYLLLSLGDQLRVAGHDLASVPLPFRWLQWIPVFGIVRVPNRFLPAAVLCLAMLAALGAGAIASLLPSRRRGWFLGPVIALVIIDYLWLPYPVRPIPQPDWIGLLDRFPRELVVFDIPSGYTARSAKDMFLQTIHGHPIATGYTASPLKRIDGMLEKYPVLRQVLERYPPEEAGSGPDLPTAMEELGVGLVVVHLDRTVARILEAREETREEHPGALYRIRVHDPEVGIPAATLEKFRSDLRSRFGPPVAEAPGEVEIYRVD